MEGKCLTYFYPKKDWKGEYGFDWFRSGGAPVETINGKGDKAASNLHNIIMYVTLHPASVLMEGSYSENGDATYSQKTIFEGNQPQKEAKYYIEHGKSLNKWYVFHEDDQYYFYFPMPSADGTSEIAVSYFDGHKVTYEYKALELCGLTCESPQQPECSFKGTAESVVNEAKKAGLIVIQDLLANPFYCQVEQVHAMDEGISDVEIRMDNPQSVKCILKVETESEDSILGGLENGQLKNIPTKVLKAVKGEAHIPIRIDNGEIVYDDIEFSLEAQNFEEQLVPVWYDYSSESLFLTPYEDNLLLYSVPTLSLVAYDFTDKRNGLANDRAVIQVHSMGDFKEVFFEWTDSEEVGEGSQIGSSKDADTNVILEANNAMTGFHLLRAYDADKKETGSMYVWVFTPIRLRICFVKVGFRQKEAAAHDDGQFEPGLMPDTPMRHPYSRHWAYNDDRYLEILGQGGIVFDDIAETSMTLDDIGNWDPCLMDNVLEYKETLGESKSGNDLGADLDKQFMDSHPEYAGYHRVYILDKYMVDADASNSIRLVTHWLNPEKPLLSPLVFFKKSIEALDTKESNPLAHALLRGLGLRLDFGQEKDGARLGYQHGTTTNMMDDTECRYSLGVEQWNTLRDNAIKLQKKLVAEMKTMMNK